MVLETQLDMDRLSRTPAHLPTRITSSATTPPPRSSPVLLANAHFSQRTEDATPSKQHSEHRDQGSSAGPRRYTFILNTSHPHSPQRGLRMFSEYKVSIK